ncbi:Cell division control protein 45 -like protein [Halotydeus destructor]|nr:Cell division control protein 45 -like protein [Halotydeus destructor]
MFIKNVRSEFYDIVVKDKVLLLVAYDVDAVCALRIIQFLFEIDNVQYTIVPVNTIEDLQVTYLTHKSNFKNIVLINFGASFDVVEELELDEGMNVFIADSHRPINLYNIYRDDQVYLLMKPDDNEPVPPYEDVIPDEEDEDDSDDEGRGYSLAELERRRNKREKKLKWATKASELIGKYSRFSYFGDSVAVTFFKLAWKMSKDSNEILWLAIVGVYDQYVNNKLDGTTYEAYCSFLQSHVTRLSHMREERVGGALSEIEVEGENVTPRSHTVAISHVQDLQLNLFRNWSLFESMRHTAAICCKFKIWNTRGEKRLLEFFAELGVPLTQGKQRYSSMELDFRKNVQVWMEALSEKYDLPELSGDGFLATKGFSAKYSACDTALAIRALLESNDKEKTAKEKFFDAVDGLCWSNTDQLEKGFELAKSQLTAILKQVEHILDMNNVGKAGLFFYTIIKESAPDAKVFSYPGSLLALARFLLKAFVAKTKFKKANCFPLIVITPDINNPGTGFIAGIPPLAENSPRNFFGEAFKQLAERRELSFDIVPEFYDCSVARITYNERTTTELVSALTQLL